jgi:putative hydrolase of the HAD superfamily
MRIVNTILLFDADGVLTLPEEVFSVVYARSHGLDPTPFEYFFKNEWKPIVTGKKDLKESILENQGMWQWDGTIEELLQFWFKSEDVRNEELIDIILELKALGIPCFLATEQEKYRGDYMKNVMFKDLFDGYFVTADLGVSKTEPKFFEIILHELKSKYPKIVTSDILFFDDSRSKINTACSVGINGILYSNVDQVKSIANKLKQQLEQL